MKRPSVATLVRRTDPLGLLQTWIDRPDNRTSLSAPDTMVATREWMYLEMAQGSVDTVHETTQQVLASLVAPLNRAVDSPRSTALYPLRIPQLLLQPSDIGTLQMALNRVLSPAGERTLQREPRVVGVT